MSAISAVGAGVEIYSDFGDRVWWGKLYETILQLGAVTIKTSLDNLRNKIKVLYTLIDSTTGEQSGQLETDWEYDTESILRYGLREFIYTSDATSETAAETQRHNLLLAMKDPKPVITTAGTKSGGKASLQVRCRGWFDDLDYRYYSKPFDETSYQEGGYGWLQFGKSTTYQKAAMSILVDATDSYKYVSVGLQVSATAPTDNVVCKIYSDSGGSPDTLLGTSDSIAASTLKNIIWTETKFTFTTAIALSASTTYWIVLERSGALSDTAYYAVDGNNDCTYADGAAKIYNGAAWAAPATAIDLQFRIWTSTLSADTRFNGSY